MLERSIHANASGVVRQDVEVHGLKSGSGDYLVVKKIDIAAVKHIATNHEP